MASVLNRATRQYIQSVNTPDYPSQDWIINPDLSAVAVWPNRYWLITGDAVTLMDAAARTAVDTAQLELMRDAVTAQFDQTEDVLRAFMLAVLDEMNGHAAKINAVLTAIDNGANFTAVKTNIAAIADYPARTTAQLRAVIRAKLGS